jgi:hypothetical protein
MATILADALDAGRDANDQLVQEIVLDMAMQCLANAGVDDELAGRLLGAAGTFAYGGNPTTVGIREGVRHTLEARLGREQLEALTTEGARLDLDAAARLALRELRAVAARG